MVKRMLKLVYNDHSPRPIEFMSGLAMALWGLWLLIPWVTFSTPAYAFMYNLAPEWIWGAAMLVLGATQLSYVLLGNIQHRKWSMQIATLVWLFIAVNFAIARIESTAVPIYSVFSLLCYWASTKLVILSSLTYGKRAT